MLHDYFAWATTTTMSRYHRSADDVPDGLRIPHWSWDGLVEEPDAARQPHDRRRSKGSTMTGLRIGALLPNVGAAASPQSIVEFARSAEALGVQSLWVGDHLLLAEDQEARYPYNDSGDYVVPSDRNFLDAFTTLAWVAGQTNAIRLGVSVCIAPYRHPAQVAKVLGTLEFLAPGRLVFGVGTGWMRDEFDSLAVPFEERNAATVRLIRFLRDAGQAEGPVTIDNAGYPTHRMFLRPQPPKDLPIWIGGNGALARKRAARHGDAWHPALHRQAPDGARRAVRRGQGAGGRGRSRSRGDRAHALRRRRPVGHLA